MCYKRSPVGSGSFGVPLITSSSSLLKRWRKCADESCAWFDFGDGAVVYHRPSGKTHLLNEASVRLLTELLQDPLDLPAIAAEFSPGEGGPSQEAFLESLDQMLRRLEQFGLIERV